MRGQRGSRADEVAVQREVSNSSSDTEALSEFECISSECSNAVVCQLRRLLSIHVQSQESHSAAPHNAVAD